SLQNEPPETISERRVEIISPTGERGTVAESDLAQALAAGARLPTEHDEPISMEESIGAVGTCVGSAGTILTLGGADLLVEEIANIGWGPDARLRTIRELQLGRKRCPIAHIIGRAIGFIAWAALFAFAYWKNRSRRSA